MDDKEWNKVPDRVAGLEKKCSDQEIKLEALSVDNAEMKIRLSNVGKLGMAEIGKVLGLAGAMATLITGGLNLFISNNTADTRSDVSELKGKVADNSEELDKRQVTLTAHSNRLTANEVRSKANEKAIELAGSDRWTRTNAKDQSEIERLMDAKRDASSRRELDLIWKEINQWKGATHGE